MHDVRSALVRRMKEMMKKRSEQASHSVVLRLLLCMGVLFPCLLGPVQAQPQGVLRPGRYPVVEQIEIAGNHKTRREVILQYLSIREGQIITPERIEANWRRLAQTNFFKNVELYTRPGSVKGRLVLVVEVVERRWPYLQFEGGHSDLNGWYFVPASLRFDNFFGRGHLAGIELYFADRMSRLSLSYANPRIFENSAYLRVSLFAGSRRFIHYVSAQEMLHDASSAGLSVQFGGRRGLFKYLFFGYRAETYEPKLEATFSENDSTITAGQFPEPLFNDLAKRKIGAISVGLRADFRDNPNFPMTGLWGALIFEAAHAELGSEINFNRVLADVRIYQKLFGQQVLAVNFKGGYAGEKAPFYERFYLGGANSLRGYPERRLTPIGYGTRHFLARTELRFPIGPLRRDRQTASGVLFFDAGGLWLPDDDPRQEDLFRAAGFGFRFNLPIVGLARVDFAFPLDKLENNDFQLHFSLGHAF